MPEAFPIKASDHPGPRLPALINKRELRRASASLGTSHSLLSAKLLKILTAILSSYVPY
jgi:hypothetical protein